MNKKQQSGVDIDLGNRCSKIAYDWAKKTFSLRPAGSGNPVAGLEGAFSNVMDYRGVKIGISSDGIGTKIELAERTGIYNTIGFDLIAMVSDDLAANGLETVNLSNILDVDFLDAAIVDQLMEGLYRAAEFARITVTGGEIAELGKRINGWGERMHFNWAATGVGILPEGAEVIDGSKVREGDSIISLKSRGFRSNGFSLLRKIMYEKFGDLWHHEPYSPQKNWGEALLTPSLIYTPLIADLIKSDIEIHAIAHITGGGIGDNLSRALKTSGLGAELNSLFEPPDFMLKVQELGEVPEDQAYRLWNMGNGMLLIVPPSRVDDVIAEARRR
ncbi:MAG: phosphoribosylformylglycinamidine cyclo-ligase, partial [Calditrichaeota bacterium]|nr:phosphoribosylformylglycinamidine cyclo-ligase [Calditrichota bacterium]